MNQQRTHSASIGRSAVTPDVVLHKATGNVGTDQAMMNEAVADCPVGGTIWMPANGDTPYARSTAWALNKFIRVHGAGVTKTLGGIAQNAPDTPLAAPYLRGAVILQTTADAHGITANGIAKHVDLRDFGIRFDDAIAFNDTGHGVSSRPPAWNGGGSDHGLFHAQWDNITVFGHDGCHYAFDLVNTLFCTMNHLRAHGGGVMQIECDSHYTNYGNLVVTHPYGMMIAGGTAHGYHQKARLADATSGVLNFNVFVWPQVNIATIPPDLPHNLPPISPTQHLWLDEGDPRDNLVIAPDLEGSMSRPACPTTAGRSRSAPGRWSTQKAARCLARLRIARESCTRASQP